MKLPKKRRCVVAVQQPRRNQKRRGANGDGGGDVFPRRINAVKHNHNNNSGLHHSGLGGGGGPAQKLVINGSLHSGSIDLENGNRTGTVVGQNGARVEGGEVVPAQLPVVAGGSNGSSAAGRKTSRASLLGGILNRQSSVHSDSQQVREVQGSQQQNVGSNSCYQQNTPNVHLFGGLHA